MLVSVQSTDAEKYNTVSMKFDIPWKCEYIKYYVSSINTMCNILLSTKDDFIIYSESSKIHKIAFEDKFKYTIKQLENILNITTDSENKLKWVMNDKRTFTIEAENDTVIEKPTHRAALLTGLYNTKFPLEIKKGEKYEIKDIPILEHTKLNLVSLQGNPVYSNINDKDYTPSLIGTINTFTIDNKPLIYDFEKEGKPFKIKTYTDSLKFLELSLVDFQYQPILLKSPLNVSLKIKPSESTDIFDVLTK